MKKLFNFRPIFLIFVGLFFGAYFSVDILFASTALQISLGIVIGVFIVLSFVKIPFFRLRRVAILLMCTSLLVGFGYSSLKILNYNQKQINSNISVSGRVTDKIIYYSGYTSVILEDVYSNQADLDGSLKLIVYGEDFTNFDTGDQLFFTSMVNSYPILNKDNLVDAKVEKTNCKYYSSVNNSAISVKEGKASFFEKIRINSRREILEHTSDEDMSNLIYSVLFGDKTYLSSDVYGVFSASGTAHLLAVSGLHVGFIVALLLLILRLFKMKRVAKFCVILAFLIAYNILCGFSPSILRASLMTITLLLSYLFGEKNDMLTSLGLSGIIILLVKPLVAFDIGFQLSFASVFGIICLAEPLTGLFKKGKIPAVLSASLAVCIAANIGTIPFVALSFRSFAYIGIISNILIIPLFAIVYCFAFLIMVLGLILPFMNALFVVVELGFAGLYKLCSVFALVSAFKITKISLLILLIYPFVLIVSNFSFLRKHIKKALSFCCIALVCICTSFSFLPTTVNASASKLAEDAVILTNNSNEVLLISQNFDSWEIFNAQQYIEKNNYEKLLTAVLITDEAENMNSVYDFAKTNSHIQLYITQNCFVDVQKIEEIGNIHLLNRQLSWGGFHFMPFDNGDNTYAVEVEYDNVEVLFLNRLTNDEVELLNLFQLKVDFIICNRFLDCYNDIEIDYNKFIASTSSGAVSLNVYVTNNVNDYVIEGEA